MFEKLFKNAGTITRHKNAPYAEERERYLAYCEQEGYAQATLKVIAYELLWSAWKLSVYPDLRVSSNQIKDVTKDWTDRENYCKHALNTQWTCNRFIRVTKQWLRFLGCLNEPETDSTPFLKLRENFTTWMEKERGLAASTIELWSNYIRQFLNWYGAQKQSINEIEISDIDFF